MHKPTGMTSADVIRDLQRHLAPSKTFAGLMELQRQPKGDGNQKRSRKSRLLEDKVKAGHGGTLDPAASGVLVVGLGSGTKQLSTFLSCTKSYEAVVMFGASTDTYDSDCTAIQHAPHKHITRELVEKALEKFRGEIKQRPPTFSALRINGKRSYDLAREGSVHEMPERVQHVDELEIVDWMPAGTHEYKWAIPKAKPTEQEEQDHRRRRRLGPDSRGKRQKPSGEPAGESASVKEEPETHGPESKSTSEVPVDTIGDADATVVATTNGEGSPTQQLQGRAPVASDVLTSEAAEASAKVEEKSIPQSAGETAASHAPSTGPAVRIRMTVNSGFYVRSLTHDLGQAVNSAAYMASLVRTRQGDFVLDENTIPFEDFEKGEGVWGPRVTELLDDWVNKHPLPPKPANGQRGSWAWGGRER